MTPPIYPMSHLCGVFALAALVLTIAAGILTVVLEITLGVDLSTAGSIGAQIGAAYIAGDRMGKRTTILPDGRWFWRAALYTALIPVVFGVIFLAGAAMYLLVPVGDDTSTLPSLVYALGVLVIVFYLGISVLAHRFVIASGARKSFDPARAF